MILTIQTPVLTSPFLDSTQLQRSILGLRPIVHPPGWTRFALGWSWQANQHDHAECLLQAERRALDALDC